jgi:hypothetical protein
LGVHFLKEIKICLRTKESCNVTDNKAFIKNFSLYRIIQIYLNLSNFT